MGREIVVIVKEGQNVISSNTVAEGSGRPLVIKAKSHQSYELKNITKGVAPDEIYVIRDGKNLKIKIGNRESKADDAADIIIEEYFEHDCHLIGVAENGQYYNYIPQGADPEASYYSLGGETLVAESETDWLPIILGVLGAGAIAAAASGGGNDTPPPEPFPPADTTPPESLTVGVYDDQKEPDEIIVTAATDQTPAGIVSDLPVTNDRTPTIKGETEANAYITIIDTATGATLGTTQADSNGNYTFVSPELQDGMHSIQVRAADSAGNSISVTTTIFEVDTTAPDAPFINPTDGSEISGTAEAGSTVAITDSNGNEIGTTTADGNGNFSYTPDTPLAHGTEIVATATDAAGNVSGPGTTTVNSTIPDAPVVIDDFGDIQGSIANNSTTDDTVPTITGSGAGANLPISVYDNGALLGTTTSDGSGNWSLEPAVPFADGSQHSITYTMNGGPASPAVQFTVDTTAPGSVTAVLTDDVDPVTGEITDGSVTNDTKPTISGTTEAGTTVTIKDGSTVLGTVQADNNGDYTFTPSTELSEGAHSVTATATDAAGNSVESATTHFTVDTSAVDSVSMTITDDVAPITGEIVNNGVTDDTTPTFSGTTEPGATVTIKDGDTVLGTVTADENGEYTFTPTTELGDGAHSVTATATDTAGNSVDSSTTNFTIDTLAPGSVTMIITDDVAPITGEIANHGVTDDTKPTFSGTTEAGATVTIKDGDTVLGTVTADANGEYSFTPTTPLNEGTHSVSATATDAAGNPVTSTTTNFSVDTTAPSATASIAAITTDTGAEDNDFITSDTTLVIDGTNDALGADEKVQISLDGGNTWMDVIQNDAKNWSYDNSANAMISGEHTLQSRVVDAAGNAGAVSTQTIIIDTTAPTSLSINLQDDEAPITGPITAGTVTDDTTPVISGHTEAGAFVTAKDDTGNILGTATADSNGNYTINPTTPLSEGTHYIQVTAEDAAGNSFTVSSVIFTVDTTAPDAPILNPTDGSQVVGTAEPGSTITITDGNGNPIGTTTANQNGNFSYTPDELIPDTTVINATATDAAGNESIPGTTTVDATITEAPVIMDDIAPVLGQVLNDDTTNDASPEISGSTGSVPANVTVTIYDNGTKIGETTSNGDGSWSFTPLTPFADGSSHSITYTKNGSTTNHSPAVEFTVDTTVPTITMALNDDVAPVTGYISEGSTTNDTRPTISGVTEANATVVIRDGAILLGTVTADGSGNYSFTPTAPLNEGAHAINATATDAAGNSVTSSTTHFTVDSIAPTVEMTISDDVGAVQGPISNGATIDDTKPTISGKTEAGATVTIKDGDTVLGTVTADSNGDYTFTPDTPLSMDEHTITATATDTAGNTTTGTPVTFTIAPPEVIDLGDDGQLINPVFVDGNWYYYWDRDGDGEGKIEGASDLQDTFTHDELDAIFMYDADGNLRPDNLTDTNDTYRYAELGGYQVALPTYGAETYGVQAGTEIDNNPKGEINPYYDDLVAIWDAFNGSGITTTTTPGTPEGWSEGFYWSASQYPIGDDQDNHYSMDLTNGLGGTNGDHDTYWAAVQVVF